MNEKMLNIIASCCVKDNDRILFNIEKKIEYPLEIFDIHNYLN